MQWEAICLAVQNSTEGVCAQHWTNSWYMATTANRGQCIRKIAWTEETLRKVFLLPEATRKYVQIQQIYSNVTVYYIHSDIYINGYSIWYSMTHSDCLQV